MLLFVVSFCLIVGWAICGIVALESDMKNLAAIFERIRNAIKDHPIVILGVIGGAIAISGHYSLHDGFDFKAFTEEFYSNYFAEIMGIVVTVYLIDRLNQQREEKKETASEKERLTVQARSGDVNEAAQAIRMLGHRGWLSEVNLHGVNLRGADLRGAHLSGAKLIGANLGGAKLIFADLSGAELIVAQLDGAILTGANLSSAKLIASQLGGAYLGSANLRDADLTDADLSHTDLSGADLSHTSLSRARLISANLNGAKLIAAQIGAAQLVGADLRNADLSDTDLRNTQLGGANLRGALYND